MKTICPKCGAESDAEFEAGFDAAGLLCPACGVRLLRGAAGAIRTSAVMISAGEDDVFFGSPEDVPEALRARLAESTSGANSGTVVIADRAGKEQLTQVLARREGRRASASRSAPRPWLPWIAFILVLLAAALFAAWFGLRW
jgi:hypothetical protein